MEWNGGLCVTVKDIFILDKAGVTYYPHDLSEFLEVLKGGDNDESVEINFDSVDEMNHARELIQK